MQKIEYRPGDPAPEDGHYEALNVFGSPTGAILLLRCGDVLPPLPLGFAWRRLPSDMC